MDKLELVIEMKVEVTQEDIDDIMCIALEGGVNYWISQCRVVGEKLLGEYASEQISRGGELELYDYEEDTWHLLTKNSFLEGLKKYLENPCCSDIAEVIDNKIRIDTSYADAEVCDVIIQLAIFGEIVYG